jgi:hypothetical protein
MAKGRENRNSELNVVQVTTKVQAHIHSSFRLSMVQETPIIFAFHAANPTTHFQQISQSFLDRFFPPNSKTLDFTLKKISFPTHKHCR